MGEVVTGETLHGQGGQAAAGSRERAQALHGPPAGWGYGSKGLALALARLRAAGLVARDGRGKNSICRLTDEGWKQALRLWMVGELEAFSEEATYDELRGTAERMYSVLLSERRAEKRVNGGHEPGATQMSQEDEELEEDDEDDEEEGWGDEEPEE